jgi:DNA-binding transcriptional LysR family regulator
LDDPAASAIRWRSASTADCVAAIEDASADLIITEHGGGQPCACIELIPVVLTEKAKQLNGSATVSEKEIIWRAQDETSHARWQVASPDAALALLRQGAGWARLPRHLVERLLDSDELAEISSEDVRRTEVELNLFTPSHAARSEAGLALRDMLLDNQRLN